MTGTCIYCGQSRMVDEKEVLDWEADSNKLQICRKKGKMPADYIATCGCSCEGGMKARAIMERYETACDSLEYLTNDKESIWQIGKEAIEQILQEDLKSVTLVYGQTTIKITKGNDKIKIDKTVKMKESMEN